MGLAVGGPKGSLAEMNVVPLIDVLLVLLIIFLVINPSRSNGLEALVPQPVPATSDKAVTPPSVVVVQVLEGGTLRINQEAATWETLEPRLTGIFKTRAERVAFIRGDSGVPFEQVARAIDIMHRADIDHVGLMSATAGSAP